MQGALTSYEEASNRWFTVAEATNPHVHNAAAALAQRTARCAYKQANNDINFIRRLVDEVKQNCNDAS